MATTGAKKEPNEVDAGLRRDFAEEVREKARMMGKPVPTRTDTMSQRVVVERGMPRRIHLESHLTEDELQKRYRAATDPV